MPNATDADAAVARFNAVAADWDDNPTRVELAQAVARAILAHVPLTGRERALEFGCGTGLVTALLAPQLGTVLAADSAEGMLAVLRDKAQALGLDNVRTATADLSREVPEGPFDLVFSSMTLHHIDDVPGLLARLAAHMTPGARLAVADLEQEDGNFHGPDVPGVMHHGFAPETLSAWLAGAGFEDIAIHTAHVIHKTGDDGERRSYPVLLATARRSS